MSQASRNLRDAIGHSLDALEMINFNNGYEAAIAGLDELSDKAHNEGNSEKAEILRWAAKELLGENA